MGSWVQGCLTTVPPARSRSAAVSMVGRTVLSGLGGTGTGVPGGREGWALLPERSPGWPWGRAADLAAWASGSFLMGTEILPFSFFLDTVNKAVPKAREAPSCHSPGLQMGRKDRRKPHAPWQCRLWMALLGHRSPEVSKGVYCGTADGETPGGQEAMPSGFQVTHWGHRNGPSGDSSGGRLARFSK